MPTTYRVRYIDPQGEQATLVLHDELHRAEQDIRYYGTIRGLTCWIECNDGNGWIDLADDSAMLSEGI